MVEITMSDNLKNYMVKYQLRSTAVLLNWTYVLNPYITGTGVRYNELRYCSQQFNIEPDIAELFLENTKLKTTDKELGMSISAFGDSEHLEMLSLGGIKNCDSLGEVSLRKRTPINTNFELLLKKRRSIRQYTNKTMRFSDLASILYAANGVTGNLVFQLPTPEGMLRSEIKLRTVGSGGGLYPIDIFTVVNNVSEIKRGLYFYNPISSKLIFLRAEDVIEKIFKSFAAVEEYIELGKSNAIFILVARIWATLRKYGSRGLRYIFIELGEISQNIHLAATALGYGSVDVQGFYDEQINEALGLDGKYRVTLHSIIVGTP